MKIIAAIAALLIVSHASAAEPAGKATPAVPPASVPASVSASTLITPPAGADLTVSPRIQADQATVSLSRITVADFLALVYAEVFKTPYILDPAVVADPRVISTRLEISKKNRAQLRVLFSSLDLSVETQNGVDYIKLKDVPHDKEQEIYLYAPLYRDTSYLTDVLRGLFTGQFSTNRAAPATSSTSPNQPTQPSTTGTAVPAFDSRAPDMLVFSGPAREVVKLKKILPQIDTKQGEVLLRATVFEVNTSASDGSGFQVAIDLLSSKLSLNLGTVPGGNSVHFKTPAIDAVFTALASDGRFKTVSSPSIRVRSGGNGHFSVGQDVPVLGAITYPSSGGPAVQSVEYRSSGVIFDVRPLVHADVVDLDVSQQISSFANTSTGVNSSPTLVKRELKTALSLADGEIVVIGGLSESKESKAHSGMSFLPAFFHSNTTDTSNADIILVLQMTRI